MPRFSKEERTVLIACAEAFAHNTADANIRARLNSALRKLKASDEHHAKREAQGARS